MVEVSRIRRVFISSDEADLIKYQLELVARPDVVKSGLQRLCAELESGRHLTEKGPFHTIIMGLIFKGPTYVRRWAYKAIALLGTSRDVEALSAKLKSENDAENLTWLISAIFKLSHDLSVKELCKQADADVTDAMMLASILYGDDALRRSLARLPIIDVDSADPLTLKWCALLAGYERAPPNLFHPTIENGQLLGALNFHDAHEVKEYSVWALWKATDFGMIDLALPIHELQRQPENVRRWTNRLISKGSEFLRENLDLFDTLSEDDGVSAREGLALGIRDVQIPELLPKVVRWYSSESDENLRELILEYIATRHDKDVEMHDMLIDAYAKAPSGSGLRRRLRAAVSGQSSNLFQMFNRIDAKDLVSKGEDLFNIRENGGSGGSTVTNNNTTFNIHGDLNTQNAVGGSMSIGDNHAIQLLSQSNPSAAKLMQEILEFSSKVKLEDEKLGSQIEQAALELSTAPNDATKGKLTESIRTAGSLASLGNFASKAPTWIEQIGNLF